MTNTNEARERQLAGRERGAMCDHRRHSSYRGLRRVLQVILPELRKKSFLTSRSVACFAQVESGSIWNA